MPQGVKTANVIWEGSLKDGKGTITNTGSGTLKNVGVTWESRTTSDELTSPEELIAAANASCFGMALSAALDKQGHTPERLEITANCTFSPQGGGITSMDLHVRGKVDGMSEGAFKEVAGEAGKNCPVSQALKGNVQYSVTAELAS